MALTHSFARPHAQRQSDVALLLLFCAGCAGAEATARHDFSQQHSCPVNRVLVTKEHGRPYLPPPKAEIASDPERLALYEHRDQVFWKASGCNERAYYQCYRPVITEPTWQCDLVLPATQPK